MFPTRQSRQSNRRSSGLLRPFRTRNDPLGHLFSAVHFLLFTFYLPYMLPLCLKFCKIFFMSILNLEEITCPCGEVFEAELLSAVSVSDNPELKEALIAGEINLVSCPKCGQMFYAERFILYHDSANEFIAFVYPLSFQNQAAQCKEKMQSEFSKAVANFSEEEKKKMNYEPFLIFGIEDLVLLLKAEQDVKNGISRGAIPAREFFAQLDKKYGFRV